MAGGSAALYNHGVSCAALAFRTTCATVNTMDSMAIFKMEIVQS